METNPVNDTVTASGAIIYARNSGRCLMLQKAVGKHQNTWGLVGGTTLLNESPWQGLQREIIEEIGYLPDMLKVMPLETFVSNDTVFNFHTYICIIDEEFIPILSDEHSAWAWATIDSAPKPLHQGLKNSFSNMKFKEKLKTIFELISLI